MVGDVIILFFVISTITLTYAGHCSPLTSIFCVMACISILLEKVGKLTDRVKKLEDALNEAENRK